MEPVHRRFARVALKVGNTAMVVSTDARTIVGDDGARPVRTANGARRSFLPCHPPRMKMMVMLTIILQRIKRQLPSTAVFAIGVPTGLPLHPRVTEACKARPGATKHPTIAKNTATVDGAWRKATRAHRLHLRASHVQAFATMAPTVTRNRQRVKVDLKDRIGAMKVGMLVKRIAVGDGALRMNLRHPPFRLRLH